MQRGSQPSIPDVPEEDDWVIVKKQKVNILIPPLPVSKKSGAPDPESKKSQAMPDVEVALNSQPVGPVSTAANPERVDLDLKSHMKLGVSNFSKPNKRPALVHERIGFHGGRVTLNPRLRASNLERKLDRAGGLSRWLVSLGLAQFVRIFQGRSIDKFQLANMTMKKLKDMGADAVGPRRKLMHALDCLCEPYCFEKF